jgi:ribosomal peptide maturation radical SAM protein 1
MTNVDVLLVNMPFASLYRPSIGLSLLKAGLCRAGIAAKVLYLTIPFAERIGSELYVRLANQEPRPTDLIAEWVFTPALNCPEGPPAYPQSYIDEVLIGRSLVYGKDPQEQTPVTQDFIRDVLWTRALATGFVNRCAELAVSHSPRIVAFTSVFQQQVSSLAMARRIKALAPQTFIVFGGHNCEGVMGAEIARQFPFVDAVVSGEGDLVFPELVRRVLASQSVSNLQGVYTRENVDHRFAAGAFPNAVSVSNMDELPYPDYDDFFCAHEASTLDKRIVRQILFESSRGCWWGERSHCAFCGLSAESMSFRSKSAPRALRELQSLTAWHPGCPVTVVDNIIDMKYFKDFVPELAALKLDVNLFYETKANLRKDQVSLMRQAGIVMVQPGIESFSSPVLDLMGKGVRALQNIQVLKWFKEYGIRPYWNILWGFPGEDPAEYSRMAELIPLLTHLPRPDSAGRIRLDRFSPHFKHAEKLGFADVRPFPAYHHVYRGVDSERVANLAYYFRYDYRQHGELEAYTRPVWEQVRLWWKNYEVSDLISTVANDQLLIWDLRPTAREPLVVVTGVEKTLYEACDAIQTIAQLKKVAENTGRSLTVERLESVLQPFLDLGLMVRENSSYLSLAIPLGVYRPKARVLQRFAALITRLGIRQKDRTIITLHTTAPGCEQQPTV